MRLLRASPTKKPNTRRDARIGEELFRESDDTVDEVGEDELLADFAFTARIRGERAIREDGRHHAVRCEVVEHVLYPREVRIPTRRYAVFPASVVLEGFLSPVGLVEGRIGEDIVRLEVGVHIVEKRPFGVPRYELRIEMADGEIHFGEFPCRLVRLLTIDGDVLNASPMFLDEFFTHDKHSATPARGVVDPTFVWLYHLDHEFDDSLRRIELSSSLPFSIGKLTKKVLVDITEEVTRLLLLCLEIHIGEEVDELTKRSFIKLLMRIYLW